MIISNYYVEGNSTNPTFLNGEYTINGVVGERNMISFYMPYVSKGEKIKVSFVACCTGDLGECVLTGNTGSYIDTVQIYNETNLYSFNFIVPNVAYDDIRVEFGFKTASQGTLKIKNLKISYETNNNADIVVCGLITKQANQQPTLHTSFPNCGIKSISESNGDILVTFNKTYKNNLRPLITVCQNYESSLNGVLRVGATTTTSCTIKGYDMSNNKISLTDKTLYFVIQGII